MEEKRRFVVLTAAGKLIGVEAHELHDCMTGLWFWEVSGTWPNDKRARLVMGIQANQWQGVWELRPNDEWPPDIDRFI